MESETSVIKKMKKKRNRNEIRERQAERGSDVTLQIPAALSNEVSCIRSWLRFYRVYTNAPPDHRYRDTCGPVTSIV